MGSRLNIILMLITVLIGKVSDCPFWEDIPKNEQERVIVFIKNDYPLFYQFFTQNYSNAKEENFEDFVVYATAHSNDVSVDAFKVFSFCYICTNNREREELGVYCVRAIKNSPKRYLKYMKEMPELLDVMALHIGSELYFSKEGTSTIHMDFQSFSALISDVANSYPSISKISNEFLEKVQDYMLEME